MLIEKDNKLSELLKINFNNFKSVRVINQDILKFDIEKFIKKIQLFLEICHTIYLLKF